MERESPKTRLVTAGVLSAILVCPWTKLTMAQNTDVETHICNGEEQSFASFKDNLSFDKDYSPPPDVLSVDYKTRDQRMLYGYMAKARDLHEAEVPPSPDYSRAVR